MTPPAGPAIRPPSSPVDRRPGDPGAAEVIARLRETAGRMVPFSEIKVLLRAAAVAIERLDAEVRAQHAEVAHLTADLNAVRAAARVS